MTRQRFDAAVARLAASQYGVISRPQVMALGGTQGVIRHRLDGGRWERLAPHVFRLAGTVPSWRQVLMVSYLAWGTGAAVSHLAAAPLWRLATFDPGPIELTFPRRRRVQTDAIVHRALLTSLEVTTLDGFRVTTPARTLLDIAAVAPRDRVEEGLDDALRRGLVSMARLRWHLNQDSWRRRRGARVLNELVLTREGGAVPKSVFETRLFRLLRRSRLPEPVRQYEVRSGGRLIAIPDFAWPDVRVAVEADSYRWHSGRIEWERDLQRRNALTLLGWRVVHVTWNDLVHRPQHVTRSIGVALADAARETAGGP